MFASASNGTSSMPSEVPEGDHGSERDFRPSHPGDTMASGQAGVAGRRRDTRSDLPFG